MARTAYKVTIAGREYSLDYRLGSKGTVRDIEREARRLLNNQRLSFADCFVNLIQASDVQAAIIWGGIKGELKKDATVDDVMDLLAEHIEQGGSIGRIVRQARRAVLASGVVGDFSPKEIDEHVTPEEDVETAVPQ